MFRYLLFLVILGVINCHFKDRVVIRKLRADVKVLQEDQKFLNETLVAMEMDLMARIDDIEKNGVLVGTKTAGKTVSLSVEPSHSEIADFESRLSDLENNIKTIKNYLMGEKKADIELKRQSESVIVEMDKKVKEAETLVEGMKTNVETSIVQFEQMIRDVNTSAHLTVNVDGVIFYGGIGSACSRYSDECQLDSSECREGKCQCMPGLSYDQHNKACIDSCVTYGSTYQTVDRYIIREFNNLTLEETTLKDCKARCVAEDTFECRSMDYFPRWKTCYLSEVVMSEVPDDAWEYNSVGRHFQRDCA